MEHLFNYISYLQKYFNLLVETEEAGELMKQEIDTDTTQRDRCLRLRKQCIQVYDNLFQTFNNDLIDLGNEVTVEISKRDLAGQDFLYSQLFDIINSFVRKFNSINKEQGFSDELIGTKFAKVNVERADGTREKESIKYDFSIAMLADDLSDKFNQLQTVINERFKFLKLKNNHIGQNDRSITNLTLLLQLYFKKGCKPLNKYDVENLAGNNHSKSSLVNKWISLKRDNYSHNGNTNNVRSFISSYEALMEIFKDDNKLFNDVKNCYDQLKETYPDLTY